MNKELEEQFPGTSLDANKLRQKLRRLRIQYTQFTELIAHAEVGWDETTNTVKANADVWDKFIKECLDMLKCNLNNRDKDINCTPPETKKSKSVTSPDKPAKGSIEEAMDVLNKMRPSMSIKEYLVASDRLSREEHTRRMFMCLLDDTRLPWVCSLLDP
ncbi:hypothetical protein CRG98_020606 [Punica granatum]|uniref:Myb/SANT-like domain-containing protein n=1 Tax=Punica granatum TaxID=22663 RepID=A0A2I0JRV3_PUNGR|nr:hypothetical protein CRG98_020606 [Punica granatum]